MLAKLVSGLHKPDDQTVLPPPEAAAFVAPLPPRALPGIGAQAALSLHRFSVVDGVFACNCGAGPYRQAHGVVAGLAKGSSHS